MTRMLIFSLICAFIISVACAAFSEEIETLTLDRAVELALEKNHSIIADQYEKDAAKWGTAASVSGYLPKVYFTSSWSRIDDRRYNDAKDAAELSQQYGIESEAWQDTYSSSLTLSQPIFNGGKELASILYANSYRKERSYNTLNTRLSLIRDVTTAYYAVLTAEQMLFVSRESVALADESLKVAQARFDIDQIHRGEVLRWEASRAEAEVVLIETENTYETAKIALANILGVEMTKRYTLAPWSDEMVDKDLLEIGEKTAAQIPSSASIGTHPSMRQVNEAVYMSKVERFSSIGNVLPSANFSYSYGWATDDTIALDGEQFWTAGVSIQIPLFQSLGGAFGIVQSHRTVQKTKTEREDARRGFVQQLHIARQNISTAQKKVQASRKSQQYATENLSIVKERHKLGMASNLKLIDAKYTYTQACSKNISAVGEFYKALAEYEYLTAKSK